MITKREQRGFTIVELIVVISAVAILAAVSIFGYGAWQESIRSTAVESDLQAAANSMEDARNFSDGYPVEIPSDFTASENVTVTLDFSTTDEYCIDGVSVQDEDITYYIYSGTKEAGPQAGTCATRTDLEVPAMPTSVAIGLVEDDSITVTWPAVAGAENYIVQCAGDAGFIYAPGQTTVAHTTGTIQGVVTGITAGTGAMCRVKAVNIQGASNWSATVTYNASTPGGTACPSNYIIVPGNSTFGTVDFCVMKYEAKNVSSVATSVAAGTPWVSISQTSAISTSSSACSGCHLITEAEWMTIVANVMSVASNWSTSTVGSGYVYNGHVNSNPASALAASTDDNNGTSGITGGTGSGSQYNNRRTLTLTNGAVIWDLAGNVNEWTSGTVTGNQPGPSGESSYTVKQWNLGTMQWASFPVISRPSTISATVGTYSNTQGIGQLYSNYGETGLRAFRRGGSWTSTNFAGVLALSLNNAPGDSINSLGFRVAR